MLSTETALFDISELKLHTFTKGSGVLAAVEYAKEIPWEIQRVFFITSKEQEDRGDHAHIEGRQAFICVSGQISLVCKDGRGEKLFELAELNEIVFVPAGIWTNMRMSPHASLAVITDLRYEESDYIRNWEDYLKYKGVS